MHRITIIRHEPFHSPEHVLLVVIVLATLHELEANIREDRETDEANDRECARYSSRVLQEAVEGWHATKVS